MEETTYQSPVVEVIDTCVESLICTSDAVEVSDPWSNDVEEW